MPGRNTILHVEDDATNRYARGAVLRRAGFEVVEARTGLEGLRRAFAGDADLVLLDVDLPDVSGVEVFRRLRLSERTSGIPVVYITALDPDLLPGDRRAATALADGFLDARCAGADLVDALVEVIAARDASRAPHPGRCGRCRASRRFAELDEATRFLDGLAAYQDLEEIAALPLLGLHRVVICERCGELRMRRFPAPDGAAL